MNTSIDSSGPIYSSLATDPDLAELVEMFVSEMPQRIETLRTHGEACDWKELRRTAHQIKGSGGSYGFDQITSYAADLELACVENASEEEVRPPYEALIDICGRVCTGTP